MIAHLWTHLRMRAFGLGWAAHLPPTPTHTRGRVTRRTLRWAARQERRR